VALRRRRWAAALVLIALMIASVPVTDAAGPHAARRTPLNARRLAFHDDMRKLWEDHITWTRLAIVSWSRAEMRSMMKAHLDETLKEAEDRLAGDYAADIRDYEVVHHHILTMADELSSGIMRQFPRRF
jgi:hypothetical protein